MLAAGFLTTIIAAAFAHVDGTDNKCIEEVYAIPCMTKSITILEQQALLKHLLSKYNTAQAMEQEVAAHLCFKCKKPDNIIRKKNDTCLRSSCSQLDLR